MDSKFYVSLEAARLLKKKGFNKTVDKLIHLNQYNIPIIESPEKYYDESEVYNDYLYLKKSHYACPTKAEAIDWLEKNGVIIEFSATVDLCGWTFSVYFKNKREVLHNCDFDLGCFPTRLEAEDAAIIKALELL